MAQSKMTDTASTATTTKPAPHPRITCDNYPRLRNHKMTAREEDAKIHAPQKLLSENLGKVWTPAGLVVALVAKR